MPRRGYSFPERRLVPRLPSRSSRDLKRHTSLWIDQLDADLASGTRRGGIGRHIRNDVANAEIFHDVVINRGDANVGLKDVRASARSFCQLLQLPFRVIPVNARKRRIGPVCCGFPQ